MIIYQVNSASKEIIASLDRTCPNEYQKNISNDKNDEDIDSNNDSAALDQNRVAETLLTMNE